MKYCCSNCQTINPPHSCSVCMATKYCNRECQRAHWKIHKPLCKLFSKPVTLASKKIIKKGLGTVQDRLFSASGLGRVADVEKLIDEEGGDVNAVNHMDTTCLWYASQNGHLRVVQVLLRRGARVNQTRGTDGVTPLFVAAQYATQPLYRFFLSTTRRLIKWTIKALPPSTSVPRKATKKWFLYSLRITHRLI